MSDHDYVASLTLNAWRCRLAYSSSLTHRTITINPTASHKDGQQSTCKKAREQPTRATKEWGMIGEVRGRSRRYGARVTAFLVAVAAGSLAIGSLAVTGAPASATAGWHHHHGSGDS